MRPPQVPAGGRARGISARIGCAGCIASCARSTARRLRRRHQRHRRHEHAAGISRRASTSRCASAGRCSSPIVQTMQRVWAIIELAQLRSSATCRCFPTRSLRQRAGTQTAKFTIRDNLRHRRDIERAYLAGHSHGASSEILIANAYFFPGIRFRRALIAAARARRARDAAAAGARRVSAAALRVAGAVRPAADGRHRDPGISPLVPAREGRRDRRHWATVGSSNIDPYSLADGARGQRVRARPRTSPTSCASSSAR